MELGRHRKHTGVYVEKRLCQNYSDQPRLQLVYGVTCTRYTDLLAVSSLQGPGARGMSLLETSSSENVLPPDRDVNNSSMRGSGYLLSLALWFVVSL